MRFVNDVLNGYTPIKNQGQNEMCWIFAMLSTIETEHIGRGDSVHLSPYFVMRCLLEDEAQRNYFVGGSEPLPTHGTGLMLVNAIEKYGVVPYDAYHTGGEADINMMARKLALVTSRAAGVTTGLEECKHRVAAVLDDAFGPIMRHIYMYSAEYTPQEFARSVCAPDEYEALTSFTHHPFNMHFDLEIANNGYHDLYLNLPIDTLLRCVEQAVMRGHGVCWEGDISEPGFSFQHGMATLPDRRRTDQDSRQHAFEHFDTTDDYCMAIVGIAHDKKGHKYFVMKNSWGTSNPYGGLMYISFDYFRLKTIAVFLPRQAVETRPQR